MEATDWVTADDVLYVKTKLGVKQSNAPFKGSNCSLAILP